MQPVSLRNTVRWGYFVTVGVTLWHHEFLGISKTVVPDFGASFSFPGPFFFAVGDSKYQEIHDVTK